jgi:hypothetical protein
MKTLAAIAVIASLCWVGPGGRAEEMNLAELQEKTAIQCGSLIYGGAQTSVCFADHFLKRVSSDTTLKAARAFTPVQIGADALFNTPFSVWSGEGAFSLNARERENLRKYLTCGGFIVASPGCSNAQWDTAFRNEMKIIFPETPLRRIPMTHQIFSTVYKVPRLTLMHGGSTTLVEGLEIDGRLALVYSREGLNDARNAKGCCCCGGDQINEGEMVNVNLFAYALLY